MEATEARRRVLDVAEDLFARKGYSAVTLRDIATGVGIKHASLYHHIPGGKEELYVEVTTRHLERHRAGLAAALAAAGPDVRAALHATAGWLLSQPPMDLLRMVHADLPAIAPAQARRISELAFRALIAPVEAALVAARERGEIAHPNLGMIAGSIIGMLESLFAVPEHAIVISREAMAREVLDVFLNGLRARPDTTG